MTSRCILHEGKSLRGIAPLLEGERELFVLYDKNVASLASEVLEALPAVKAAIALETSEQAKTLQTVQSLERWLLAGEASRGALLLAIGGGITTDIAGFTAGIYKRGIRYANLPTTLLAQVDAAIGGKTGVNLDGYKNMLGLFKMPEFTFLCPDALKTLPARELRCGVAELLKTFLLADAAAYEKALHAEDPGAWAARAAAIKAEIVARDPFEEGERAKLNLGHTFAHAIEHRALQCGDDIAHGEAVAMGIILAARLGESLGLSEKGLAAQLVKDFEGVGLSVHCPYPLQELQEAMAKDKKAQGASLVRFVIPVRKGEVTFQSLNPHDLHFVTE